MSDFHRPIPSVWLFSFVLIMAAGFLFLWDHFEKRLAEYDRETVGTLTALHQQVARLAEELSNITGRTELAELSLKEVEKRSAMRQESQEDRLTKAVAKATPSVVSIVISKEVPQLEVVYQNPFGNDPFFRNFGIQVPVYRQKGTVKQKVGAGTGFFVSSDGTILTNKHVVADQGAEYTVLLADGGQRSAKVIYRDEKNDLALIKIDGNYETLKLKEGEARLGQTVIAIGNALGEFNNSVSVGIISGFDRTITAGDGAGREETLSGVIQTDAAINRGNSGGPLIDLEGEVVGINVATVIGSNNVSFAIPIKIATNILRSLKIANK